ncbi:LTA synthase family protein [Adlercreutzia sp. ZJ138]|uniref:LTA synthase family protein n=1 Tax=Adlercreutzia sp. ZJ138 TaxID=2709405 RepID=UPI0013EAB1BE|nr:LTA synthase family protein [Adlercreutzia sp. ZJ138]
MRNQSGGNLAIARACTVVKLLFMCAIAVAATHRTDTYVCAASVVEAVAIFLLSALVWQHSQKAGWLVNSLLALLYSAQMAVLHFGGSYISVVMLSNVCFASSLSGNAVPYLIAAVVAVGASFLPVHFPESLSRSTRRVITGITLACSVVLVVAFSPVSPMLAWVNLGADAIALAEDERAVSDIAADDERRFQMSQRFKNDSVVDFREKDARLADRPNVVLIFMEGLSQHVIEDEREIMPNVDRLQASSLSFMNYYNHTFATGRGLAGQLYSGYQLDNLGENGLVSLQDLLAAEGYSTTFINTEPRNTEFSDYLSRLGFAEFASDASQGGFGPTGTLSDREAFERLYDTMERAHADSDPFFISLYTFGTHASLDSPDKRFGDGSSAELNKFYNADWWLGEFMNRFQQSDMARDTIIVLTSDHCTYADAAYREAFPDAHRESAMCDRIPLIIYARGMEPETVDAYGRNSLDLTPTVCDYLDVSGENFFLGTSLFADAEGSEGGAGEGDEEKDDADEIAVGETVPIDCLFTESVNVISTEDANVREAPAHTEAALRNLLRGYYAIAAR